MNKILEQIARLKGDRAYTVISREDAAKIDAAARRIMVKLGFRVSHPKVLEALSKHGFKLDGEIVRVSSRKLDRLLEKVPKHREQRSIGKASVVVGYMINQIYDADKDIIRYPTRKDLDNATVVGLSLPEVSHVNPLFEPKDSPGREDVLMLDVMLRRTKMPRHNEILKKPSIPIMLDMCKVVAGSKEDALKRNMLAQYAFVTSPLKYDYGTLDLALAALAEGIPVRFGTPMNIAGASGPVTLAGTLALGLADAYSGLALSEVYDQPWVPGMAPVVMEPHSGATLYSGPECTLMCLAVGDLHRYLGLGGGVGHLAPPDACKPGFLAGVEKAYSLMVLMLGGCSPVLPHGGGLGPGGLVGCVEQIVIDAEIASMFNRMLAGIRVDDQTIALDVILEVGLDGSYLDHEHTAAHFREELWLPRITRRVNPSQWNQEKPDMLDEAKKKVKELLAANDPRALSPAQERELDRILARP